MSRLRVRWQVAGTIEHRCTSCTLPRMRVLAALLDMQVLVCRTFEVQKGLLEHGRSSTTQTIMPWPVGSMWLTFPGRLMLLCAAASGGADGRSCAQSGRPARDGRRVPATVRAALGQMRSACQLPSLGSNGEAHTKPVRKPMLTPRLFARVKRTSLFGALRTTCTRCHAASSCCPLRTSSGAKCLPAPTARECQRGA